MRNLRLCTALLFVIAVSAFCQEATPTPSSTPPATSPLGTGTSAPVPPPEKPLHIGGMVKPPVVVYAPDPTFSDQARAAHFSGTVQVYLWVDEHGNPSHVRVVRGVGMGLDEKAVEAIRQYKFQPATLNGTPVKVDLYIQVNFQIRDHD